MKALRVAGVSINTILKHKMRALLIILAIVVGTTIPQQLLPYRR